MRILPGSKDLIYFRKLNNVSKNATGDGTVDFNNELSKTVKKFDEITINKNKVIPDDKFAEGLKNQIMKEVNEQPSQKALEELKIQIENDTYQVGIDEIARKIML